MAAPPTSPTTVSNTVTPIATATNTAGTAIAVGNGPIGIAITPDGSTAYVANAGSNNVTRIATATNTAGTAIAVGTLPFAIAITPDQAPVAAFAATAAPPGSPTVFDASGSSDADGQIATYAWDFGDGDGTTASSPTDTAHAYAAAGTYTATLTVTDGEGCSTALVFTGQTASCNGASSARRAGR